MAISIWWLIPTAVFGACIGLVALSLCLSISRANAMLDAQDNKFRQSNDKHDTHQKPG